jgi:hypothetical protein
MIISVSGRAGSGKDTVGKIIHYILSCNRLGLIPDAQEYVELFYKTGNNVPDTNFRIKKWADPLRQVAAIMLGVDLAFTYTDEFKQMTLPDCWDTSVWNGIDTIEVPITGREFLQKLGTADAIRNNLHENAWINALMSEYKIVNDDLRQSMGNVIDYSRCFPNWIITDTRFPNELAAVKERGGITIRVNRKWMSYEKANTGEFVHESETALDNAEFDYIIENNGTIEELVEKCRYVLKKSKLI